MFMLKEKNWQQHYKRNQSTEANSKRHKRRKGRRNFATGKREKARNHAGRKGERKKSHDGGNGEGSRLAT